MVNAANNAASIRNLRIFIVIVLEKPILLEHICNQTASGAWRGAPHYMESVEGYKLPK